MNSAYRLLLLVLVSFVFCDRLLGATKEEVIQAIADEKKQVEDALAMCKITAELQCDTRYWAHNMIRVRYENGIWYYTCGNPCLTNGIQATNVYYCQ